MPADHYVMDSDMKKVADAIRTKGETAEPLVFPDGMAQAISDIKTGDNTMEDGLLDGSSTVYENDRVLKVVPYTFYYNSNLTEIRLDKATLLGQNAISYCDKITTLFLPEVTTVGHSSVGHNKALTNMIAPKVKTGLNYVFSNNALKSVDLPNLETLGQNAFSHTDLTSIILPKLKTIDTYSFGDIPNISRIDFGESMRSIENGCFYKCPKLTALILRNKENPVTLFGDKIFDKSPLGQLYVPDNLVEQYKTATYWSMYASRIHPISELPPE